MKQQENSNGIFLPSNRRIGSCLTRRTDIVWIESSSKKSDILELIKTHSEYSFFPVCSGTIDSVLGILSALDFITALYENTWTGLKQLVKKPVFFPETATILKTLSILEESKTRMGFVIDEYGGIEGLVTRNGLITELLEELENENQEADPSLFKRADGSLLVDGDILIDEINKSIQLPNPDETGSNYYTLAGYLLAINGSIPNTGDLISAGNYRFEIVDMDGHRIDKVLIFLPDTLHETEKPSEL